jgi:hypothetical protein
MVEVYSGQATKKHRRFFYIFIRADAVEAKFCFKMSLF